MGNFYRKLIDQTIYLWEDFEEVFVKLVPGRNALIKKPGGEEYEAGVGSDIVIRAIAGEKEVTKQQYESGRL